MSATGDKYLEDIFEFLYLPNNLSSILVKRLILDVPGEWSIVTNFSGQFIRQKRELSHENLAAI